MTSKVLRPKKLLLNGIFGVFKESGYSVDDYKTWIRLTHWHESEIGGYEYQWSSPSLIVDIRPQYCEPFTTGVLYVGIGRWAERLTTLSYFLTHEWIISLKLGTETEKYFMGSPVVRQMPFDHINKELLAENLKPFIGRIEQTYCPPIWKEPILITKKPVLPPKVWVETPKTVPRISECQGIDILSFEPPDIKLKVISDGSFRCRTFVHDLGISLGSCAHLTALHLRRIGDLTEEQCLQKYELHFCRMSESIEKYSKQLTRSLHPFTHLKPYNRRTI